MAVKKVRFSKKTFTPKIPEQCSLCRHRNITPRIRQMDICINCTKIVCDSCLNTMSLCVECEEYLFDVDSDTGIMCPS